MEKEGNGREEPGDVLVVDYWQPAENNGPGRCHWCSEPCDQYYSVYLAKSRTCIEIDAYMCAACRARYTVPSEKGLARQQARVPDTYVLTAQYHKCTYCGKADGFPILLSNGEESGTCNRCCTDDLYSPDEIYIQCLVCLCIRPVERRNGAMVAVCDSCLGPRTRKLPSVVRIKGQNTRSKCFISDCIFSATRQALYESEVMACSDCAIEHVHVSMYALMCTACPGARATSRKCRPRLCFGRTVDLVPQRCVLCRQAGDVDLTNTAERLADELRECYQLTVEFRVTSTGYSVASIPLSDSTAYCLVVLVPGPNLAITVGKVPGYERRSDDTVYVCFINAYMGTGAGQFITPMIPSAHARHLGTVLLRLACKPPPPDTVYLQFSKQKTIHCEVVENAKASTYFPLLQSS